VRPALLALAGVALAVPCARAAQPAPASPAVLAAGERAYQKCYACHAVDPGDKGAEGPSLRAIIGRKVAAVGGYAYSEPMKAYAADGKTWTRERLDAYLADPQSVVPNNTMGFFGMPDANERAALIAWLAEQR
jgi:cytochrome c